MFHVLSKKRLITAYIITPQKYFLLALLQVVSADKYHHMCRYEMSSTDVPLISWHDGSAGPQNKAGHGEWVHLNQMGHSIIPHQWAVNVVSGSHVSSHLASP